jgi:hypothetical protein
MKTQQVLVAGETVKEAVQISAPFVEGETEHFLMDDVAKEKFMNEIITIMVFSDGREGSLDTVSPEVNGHKVVIQRDKPTKVRRYFAEALANAKTTTIGQQAFNPNDPRSLFLINRTFDSFPFQLIEDANPMGPAWLKSLRDRR